MISTQNTFWSSFARQEIFWSECCQTIPCWRRSCPGQMKQGRGREELLGGKVIHATVQCKQCSVVQCTRVWGGYIGPQRLHLISHCHGLTAGLINWLHIISIIIFITFINIEECNVICLARAILVTSTSGSGKLTSRLEVWKLSLVKNWGGCKVEREAAS